MPLSAMEQAKIATISLEVHLVLNKSEKFKTSNEYGSIDLILLMSVLISKEVRSSTMMQAVEVMS